MQLTVDFWQLVGLATGFLVFCVGACGAVGRMLLSQTQKHLDERFANVSARLDGIEAADREEANLAKQLEREFLSFKADLPLHYVRREDYIRGQSTIEAKLDGLAMKLENVQLRGMLGAKNEH